MAYPIPKHYNLMVVEESSSDQRIGGSSILSTSSQYVIVSSLTGPKGKAIDVYIPV